MKDIFKGIHKKRIFKVFMTVLIGVICGIVAFNISMGEKEVDSEKRTNFLIVGNDNYNQTSDAIFILSVDTMEKDIRIITIPSSTLVSLNGTKTALSNVYSAGGIQILIDKITQIIPVPVDNYVIMDYQAFRYITDSLGGVDIEVPFDMNYYDSKINYKINLKKGKQHLDGKKAEMFIRYIPEDNEFGITREANQKAFFKELISQCINNDTEDNLADLLSKILPYITSDITISDTPKLLRLAKGLNNSLIETISVYGKYEYRDNTRYFVSDYEKNKNILN